MAEPKYEGAFVPEENPEREARYLRMFGHGSSNPITKLMASLYDDPKKTDEFYKWHLADVQDGCNRRKLVCELPARDTDEHSRHSRNFHHNKQRMKDEQRPEVLPPPPSPPPPHPNLRAHPAPSLRSRCRCRTY